MKNIKKKVAILGGILCLLLNSVSLFASGGQTVEYMNYTPKKPVLGDIKGLTLLIDFPDINNSGSFKPSKEEVSSFLNDPGYTGYNNNGSVRDYFYINSNQKVNYTNYVADYYTTPKNFNNYHSNSLKLGDQGHKDMMQELVYSALMNLKQNNFDFSGLSLDENRNVRALSLLVEGDTLVYTGDRYGLFPHNGGVDIRINVDFDVNNDGSIDVNDYINFNTYMVAPIGRHLTLAYYLHETGHMVFGWPDQYHNGIEEIMGSSFDDENPPPPSPYCRNIVSGWGNLIKLNDYPDGSRISVPPNSVDAYIYYSDKDNHEYFLVNSVDNTIESGKYCNPNSEYSNNKGLQIWHIYDHVEVDAVTVTLYRYSYRADSKNSLAPFTTPNTDSYQREALVNFRFVNPLCITQINYNGTSFIYHGTQLPAPKNPRSVDNENNVDVVWDSVVGANHYEVKIDNVLSYSGINTYVNVSDKLRHNIQIKAKDMYDRVSQAMQCRLIPYGDLNNDGNIDSIDKVLVSRYLSKIIDLTNEQKVAADVDNSGTITSEDINLINDRALNYISDFPNGRARLIVYGDINNDGIVSIADIDVMYTSDTNNFTPAQFVAADVNKDGIIDAFCSGFDADDVPYQYDGYDTKEIRRFVDGFHFLFPATTN